MTGASVGSDVAFACLLDLAGGDVELLVRCSSAGSGGDLARGAGSVGSGAFEGFVDVFGVLLDPVGGIIGRLGRGLMVGSGGGLVGDGGSVELWSVSSSGSLIPSNLVCKIWRDTSGSDTNMSMVVFPFACCCLAWSSAGHLQNICWIDSGSWRLHSKHVSSSSFSMANLYSLSSLQCLVRSWR